MPIDRGKVVTLSYELRDCDGQALDDEGSRMAYLHGYGTIFPKVEAALDGRDVGHEVSLTLEPEDAFGDYDAELLRVEPRGRFPETLEVGMRFEGVPGERERGQPPRGRDSDDALIYTVTDIAAEKVVVDGNHPLAGERLWFKCRVLDVRDATAVELEHGHAHEDEVVTVGSPPAAGNS
jgi:FKBP-type peptidyl-prolyl cis-trans isomerase SlyD